VRAIGTSTFPASEIVEAQWVAERRGLERFGTEQPPYSIINRSIEREVLPIGQRYGMGTLVWSPLGQGLLTGRYRTGQQADTHRSGGSMPQQFSDERKLDVVEQLIPLAEEAGLPMTHLAYSGAGRQVRRMRGTDQNCSALTASAVATASTQQEQSRLRRTPASTLPVSTRSSRHGER
jgi:hypothetical protein